MMRHKLGTLCSVVTKGTTPTSIGLKFEESGVPFLRIQNLRELTVSLEDCLYVSADTHEALKRSKIRAGDFLITIAGTIGRVAIVPDDFPECNCNQAVAILRFDRTKLLSRYLLHWLSTDDALIQIRGKKVTATISNLSLSQIKELEIPLPPLEEQKRIAAILDKADAIRQKRKQAIDLADEFLRSVFLDMFGDPVTNPKGWEVKNIVDLAAKEKHAIKRGPFGGALKKDIFVDSGYLVYEQYHALNNDFEFARYFIDESKYQELEAFKVSVGDIIISCSGVNLGRLAIVPEGSQEGIINQALLKVKLDESKMLNDMFVAIFTHPNFKNEFFGDHRGSGVPNFPPMSTFKEFGFIVPPLDEQKRYLKVVDKVRELKRKIVNSVSSADEQFNSLSQKAFSGQL
ncbi:TPA: restriction endonuclease subunit S [Vibrio parahaemolyticus]